MAHANSRVFDFNHREGSPQKKTRTGLSNDEVKDLNLKGISNMVSGHDDEAERCFAQALVQFDSEFSSRVGSAYTNVSSRPDQHPCSSRKLDAVLQTLCAEDGCDNASCDETLLYIYQRQEYDEGLYAYTDALPFDDSSNELVRSATLLYNVAQTHVHRGRYYEAKKWFELALLRLKRVNAVENSPLNMIRIYHNLGHCFYRVGKNEDALRCYKNALSTSKRSQLGEYHLATSKLAVGVLLFHGLKDLEVSLELFESALAVYRAEFGQSKEVATILNNIGRVHYLQENYNNALLAYGEALLIRRRCLGKYSIDVAATVCNIGQTHHHMGNLDEAMEFYKEFLVLGQRRLGANHRDIALICRCIAEIYHERGDRQHAKEMYEKALTIAKGALGPYHPELITTLNKLGNLHYEMHDLDAALRYYTEGLGVERIALEPCHPNLLVTLMNIALIHRNKGNFAAALVNYAEIHSLQTQLFGPNSLEVADTLSKMGTMEYQLQAYSVALSSFQAAVRIQREHYQTDCHLDVAATLNSIGLVHFNQGAYAQAKACFVDSLGIRRKLLGPDHNDLAILWYNLATVYLETGEDDIAIKLYNETLRIERLALDDKHGAYIMTLQHLGLVHQDRGELDEALNCFSQAMEIEKNKQGNNSIALGKLLNLMGNIHLRKGDVDEMMRCYSEALRLYRQEGKHDERLVIAGYCFYGFSKLHPPCAAMA